jgi:hypothetical protein
MPDREQPRCPYCLGSGKLPKAQDIASGTPSPPQEWETCLGCGGTGRLTADDRRADHEIPHRIALLRDQPLIISPGKEEAEAPPVPPPGDEPAPIRAAVVAVLIGALMWAVAIFAIWYFM